MINFWRNCDLRHFIVFLYVLTPIFCNKEDYYIYDVDDGGIIYDNEPTDFVDNHRFQLEQQQQRHSINKRDTLNSNININNSNSSSISTGTNRNDTIIKTIDDENSSGTVFDNTRATSSNDTLSKTVLDKNTISPFKKVPDKTTNNNNNNSSNNNNDSNNNNTTLDLKAFTSTDNFTNPILQSNRTIEFEVPDDFSISNFSDSTLNLNKTLSEHNVQKTQTDTHLYYNSTFIVNKEIADHYWMNMTGRNDVLTNDVLSKSHRRAATVKLSFDFPFYGHLVRNVTIATGGFLYTGEYVHSWLAATQYVAPLMANFDTSLSKNSLIRYVDNGTAFTVQWEKVSLQDKPNGGEFTFQVTLHNTGDIVFVYKHIPLLIENIQDHHHPVKVGLSDAYIINRTIFFIHRKTIYEYHRVQFKKEDISNWTVVYLNALPTCLSNKDCESCFNSETNFQCWWCPQSKKCSNGLDRYRQDWLTKGCDRNRISNLNDCSMNYNNNNNNVPTQYYHHDDDDDDNHFDNNNIDDITSQISSKASKVTQMIDNTSNIIIDKNNVKQNTKASVSGVSAIFLLLALISSIGIWILYAYRNPHSTSGQILIKYRPSQWRWRRGEARYTAATIHM